MNDKKIPVFWYTKMGLLETLVLQYEVALKIHGELNIMDEVYKRQLECQIK